MSSENSHNFDSSSSIWILFIYLFIYLFIFVWLLWPVLPVLCWITVMKADKSVLLLILREMLLGSCPLSMILYWFVIYGLYNVQIWSQNSHFAKSFFFIINGCWILSNAISESIYIIMWLLSFLFFMWYTVYWFVNMVPNLHPQNKSYLIMVCGFLKLDPIF